MGQGRYDMSASFISSPFCLALHHMRSPAVPPWPSLASAVALVVNGLRPMLRTALAMCDVRTLTTPPSIHLRSSPQLNLPPVSPVQLPYASNIRHVPCICSLLKLSSPLRFQNPNPTRGEHAVRFRSLILTPACWQGCPHCTNKFGTGVGFCPLWTNLGRPIVPPTPPARDPVGMTDISALI